VQAYTTIFMMIQAIHTWLTARGGLRQLPKFLSLLFGVGSSLRADFIQLARKVELLYRRNGATFTIAYLKECVRVVQHYAAGVPLRACEGSVMVGLSGGLPTLLPTRLRGWVRSGHTICTVCALSILGVYRGFVTPGVLKIESIVGPFTGKVEDWQDFSSFLPKFFAMLPRRITLGRPSFAVLSTSVGPNGGRASISALKDAAVLKYCETDNLTHLLSFVRHAYGTRWYWAFRLVIGWLAFVYSVCALQFPFELVSTHKGIDRQDPDSVIAPTVGQLRRFLNRIRYYLRILLGMRLRVSKLGLTARLSRLHEAAGKIRIVAIVDFWTQMALKPLHRAIFAVLREIPNDGTFGQEACVDMLRRKVGEGLIQARGTDSAFTAYSYDLSSATDRIPVDIYQFMLTRLFDGSFSVFWRALLTFRNWEDRWSEDDPVTGRVLYHRENRQYAVGQPMGAYSSWAMLALAHHAIVQYCAHLEGIQGWFGEYGIVGDDIVILNGAVARRYLAVVTGWGVSISMSKSLVSSIGTFEFCKRIIGPNGDLSGIPIGLIYQAFKNPGDSATLFAHVHRRGHSLFPIAIARTVAFLLRVPPRFTTPIWNLQNQMSIVFAMLVQPGFPLWQGISLVQALPSLTVEGLDEWVRTHHQRPTQEIGLYKFLEDLAFASHLAALLPVNWKKPLETVVPDLNRVLSRRVPRGLAMWIILWMTPLGWWLMSVTARSAGLLFVYALRAYVETVNYPVASNFYTRYLFWVSRIRARFIEDYRGSSRDFLTVVNRASGRTLWDVSFTSELKERRSRRRMTWILKSVLRYRPGIEAPLDDLMVTKV
jgi:hypothetical protein